MITISQSLCVPGEWVCPSCSCRLHKMALRASDGAVGVDPDTTAELCPNGCAQLRPLTWRESAEEGDAAISHLLEELRKAKSRIEALEVAWPDGEFPMPAELIDDNEH